MRFGDSFYDLGIACARVARACYRDATAFERLYQRRDNVLIWTKPPLQQARTSIA